MAFVAGDTSTPSPVRVVLRMKHSAAPYWPAAASHIRLSAVGSKDLSSYHNQHLRFYFCSVEALAPALVPVAVDHQANDDEEDTTQHGEEHGEENGYSTHPFFSRTQSE